MMTFMQFYWLINAMAKKMALEGIDEIISQ